MSAVEPQHTQDRRAEVVLAAWQTIRACLEAARARIYDEIRNYPRPIPACDQQFNCLLEQRADVSEELDRLGEAARESLTGGDSLERIDAFIDSSRYLDDPAKQAIRSSLRGELPAREP
jgi:hypothetical protein